MWFQRRRLILLPPRVTCQTCVLALSLLLVGLPGGITGVTGSGGKAWAAAPLSDHSVGVSPRDREEAARKAMHGWTLLESGQVTAAAASFTEALRLVPDEPRFLVGLGVCSHRLGQDELAIPLLQRALERDPTVGLADRVLGDIYLGLEDFQRATDHYERAAYQDPNDASLRDRLMSARQATLAEAQSSRIFSAHFVVRYPDSAQHRLAAEAVAALEEAYTQIRERLGYAPPEPLTVFLYPRRQFVELTAAPHWVGGLFDGKLHLPLESLQGEPGGVQEVITHEYTHAAVDYLSAGRAPTWLDEGLALEFSAQDRSGLQGELESVRGDLMPLRSLHGSFLTLTPAAARVIYLESRVAVVDLMERYGLEKVQRLLRALARDPNFARAFETVMGTTYQQYDETWLARRTRGRL